MQQKIANTFLKASFSIKHLKCDYHYPVYLYCHFTTYTFVYVEVAYIYYDHKYKKLLVLNICVQI